MTPEETPKTAITTLFGSYEFLRMPYGLRNSAQTFQRFMDHIFSGMGFIFVYVDDVLIASSSITQHIQHLQEVFRRFSRHGMLLNPSKCTFGVDSLAFLGHHISAAGIKPLEDRVTTIRDFQRPETKKQLKRFLGLINFYRRFVPQTAALLAPSYPSSAHILTNLRLPGS